VLLAMLHALLLAHFQARALLLKPAPHLDIGWTLPC
jgi:hypothetical protein